MIDSQHRRQRKPSVIRGDSDIHGELRTRGAEKRLLRASSRPAGSHGGHLTSVWAPGSLCDCNPHLDAPPPPSSQTDSYKLAKTGYFYVCVCGGRWFGFDASQRLKAPQGDHCLTWTLSPSPTRWVMLGTAAVCPSASPRVK